jgi:hypothetical protein
MLQVHYDKILIYEEVAMKIESIKHDSKVFDTYCFLSKQFQSNS